MDHMAQQEEMYFFMLDYTKEKGLCLPVDEAKALGIHFQIGPYANYAVSEKFNSEHYLLPYEAPDQRSYQKSFEQIFENIQLGNSYLINLCTRAKLLNPIEEARLFHLAQAPYKLWIPNEIIVFSPETFVQIDQQQIQTFPMKGTRIKHSEMDIRKLQEDPKEKAEHYTIVDLMRNDLGIIGTNIQVDRFAYVDEIRTEQKTILQMSSAISAQIQATYQTSYGQLLDAITPAGSITGAPKERSCTLIAAAENTERKFYTGIMGVGKCGYLSSAVMIRCIQRDPLTDDYYYHTGGGITSQSQMHEEYQELLNKIYVPTI